MASPDPRPHAGLGAVSLAYGLGAVRSCRYLPEGVLNRNWRIGAERGVFALKELAGDPGPARRGLGLLDRLAAAGVPVARAVPAASGAAVPELGGRHYYLVPWVEGGHPRGADMDRGAAFHMGAVIGRLHRALADPAAGLPAPEAPSGRGTTVEEARERIGGHLDRIERCEDPDAFDTAAAGLLRGRLALLADRAAPPPGPPPGPFGWVHGDCQNWNLLWSGGRIAAVLDWDRVCVKPYGEEIARAAVYQFALPDGRVDLGNVAALVAGYRTEAPIDADALVAAARHRWWRMASSVWHLEHRRGGDRAVERLLFADERLLRWWSAHTGEVEAAFAA